MEYNREQFNAILKNDLASFIKMCFFTVSPNTEYLHNWHIDLIAEYLEACRARQIKKLIINIPPRYLKSIAVNVAFPAWLLGHNPSERIISSSYALSISMKQSLDCRLVMQSEWYRDLFPHVQLVDDQNTKGKFVTTERGHRIATATGSSLTGEGGNFLITDDPINAVEASSEVVRQSTNDWFDQAFSTRLDDKKNGVMIVIMQRLHTDDLTGHLLKKGGWELLKIPAQAFTPITYKFPISGLEKEFEEGELLHEEREDRTTLAATMNTLGSQAFAGQYLQEPAPIGGGEFKKDWIQHYDNTAKSFTPQGMNIYICVDPANQKKTSSDYTAMMVVGLAPDKNYYVLDIVRDRLNPTERIKMVIKLHMKWSKLSGNNPKVIYEQYGMMTDSFYLKKAQEQINYRFPITEVGGKLKKEDRIRKLVPLFEGGRIYLPKIINYTTIENKVCELVKPFIEDELMTFPVSTHDDMLDALARVLEPEAYASFPKIDIKINRVGWKPSDDLDNYNSNDFMSW